MQNRDAEHGSWTGAEGGSKVGQDDVMINAEKFVDRLGIGSNDSAEARQTA